MNPPARAWPVVLGVMWVGACAKRGKSTGTPASHTGEPGDAVSAGDTGDTAGEPTDRVDTSALTDTADSGDPPVSRPRLEGEVEAEIWHVGSSAGGELGARVVWTDEQAWVSEPGAGGRVMRLPDGPTFSADDVDAHLGVALTSFAGGVLAGAWSRPGGPEGDGAVYLLTADVGDLTVESDVEPVLVLYEGVVGMVLLGEGVGEHPDGWLLGQPRSEGDRGLVALRAGEDHDLVAEWRGVDGGDLAGGAMATADLNGDGLRDLAVGAWGQGTFAGAAYAVYGPFSGLNYLEDADATWTGERWCLAGYTLAAGDVTGDGLEDLVVGSFGDTRNGSGSGAFTVVPGGSPTGLVQDFDAHRLGESPDAHFSAGLAVADVDLDGMADVVAGAPDGPAGGTARLYYGPVEGTGTAWDAQAFDPDGAPRDSLGASMALRSDAGWLIGAPGAVERRGRVLFVDPTLPLPE